MEVDKRIVAGGVWIFGFRRLSLVLRIERRMQARLGHVFHVSSPGELMRLQLVRDRLYFGGEHASFSRDLPIQLHLDQGAGNEVLVNLAIALRNRVGSLPAYQRDVVVQTVVPDGVVVGEQL